MARKGPLARLVVASLALAPLDLLDQPSKLLESVGVLKSLLKGAKRIITSNCSDDPTYLFILGSYLQHLLYIYKHAYINMYHVYIHCICMDHSILYIYQHKSSLP